MASWITMQRRASRCSSSPGPGSGKTNTLAHRVAHLIVNGADPRKILLMTFSRRAAAEMTRRVERIARRVIDDSAGVLTDVLWAGTFHGIGARLLRDYAGRLRRGLYGGGASLLESAGRTALAPWISSLRRLQLPRLVIPARRGLPPVVTCGGTRPSHAARSRPKTWFRRCRPGPGARRLLEFRSVRGGFRAPVSARHFSISISVGRRPVRLTETGSQSALGGLVGADTKTTAPAESSADMQCIFWLGGCLIAPLRSTSGHLFQANAPARSTTPAFVASATSQSDALLLLPCLAAWLAVEPMAATTQLFQWAYNV
jgi:UvrD/REP helicase N-terminal domain